MVDDDLDEVETIKVFEKKNLKYDIKDETLEIDEIVNIKESRNHPLENVTGNLNQRILDESWIIAMQEELNHFIGNDVWELVPQPKNMTIIGTKWVFRNKLDGNNVVSQNKARLVAQGYNQQEGIDYDETYAPVTRLESIRILLAYAFALDFKLFQMDVKSAFLNDLIDEEVYVAQPSGFTDFENSDHVYRLKKALYDLKQAPKAWSVGSSGNTNGLDAIVSKLDNLGRDIKKLKENVHAIQVGCQIYKGTHFDKECPLNEEVKEVEKVKYREFRRIAPFNRSTGAKFRVGPPWYYTRTDDHPPYEEKRPTLEELMNKHQEESARRSTKIELTKELHSRNTNGAPSSTTEECKAVYAD
uniref:Retrovirus-related Pol polyprotein from transposon TNT 1-94 n=1 Tax=Tanacetum cinerariifolium TaxID=118510 RepID=A0A6L2LDX4_TANCI|nr:retrovirus-related Pol polyprotein from transposon TNT 1-94 [Tanacetum cinerariifolium]